MKSLRSPFPLLTFIIFYVKIKKHLMRESCLKCVGICGSHVAKNLEFMRFLLPLEFE